MLRLYRNGVEVGATPCQGVAWQTSPKGLAFGCHTDESGLKPDRANPGSWDGQLDEIAVFNRALTVDQVRQLYVGSASVAGGFPKRSASVITPTAIFACSSELVTPGHSDNYGYKRFTIHTIDGSGLWDAAHNNFPDTSWLTAGKETAPLPAFITFDLGANYDLINTHVWNYNEMEHTSRGAKDVTISVANSLHGPFTPLGTFRFEEAPAGDGNNTRQNLRAPRRDQRSSRSFRHYDQLRRRPAICRPQRGAFHRRLSEDGKSATVSAEPAK